MVTGIADSTVHSPVLRKWAEPYFPNIFVKYEEVQILLFSQGGVLAGGSFRSNRDQILAIAREMIVVWGNAKSADQFIDDYLMVNCTQVGRKQLIENGVLTEFFKQSDLCSGYANDLAVEFAKIGDGSDLSKANANIRLFFKNCGDGVFSFSDIKQWIELMSVTGLLHGGTLSFTRFIMTAPLISLISEGDTYTKVDSEIIKVASATIVGMSEERAVFSDQLRDKTLMNPGLKQVITKYAAASLNLKAAYFDKIQKEDYFIEDGWILTDFCLDGIDGKQTTLTTYI
jgi:hypothetical protein